MILVQQAFGEGIPPADISWFTMVLIIKGKGGYWGIGLVEVAWKVCTEVVNFQLKLGVVLNDALHRFRGGWGSGTSMLESKLAQ